MVFLKIVSLHETIMLFSRVKCWEWEGAIIPTQLIKMSQRGVLTHPARWNGIKAGSARGGGYISLGRGERSISYYLMGRERGSK